MKRDRDSAELDNPDDANGSNKQLKPEVEEDVSPEKAMRPNNRVRSGAECPYLDTISRQVSRAHAQAVRPSLMQARLRYL